jgi:hypothetical protein
MKMVIKTDEIGDVTLAYDDLLTLEDDRRMVRVFTCPLDGGFVRERVRNDWKQVCDGLARTGNALMCNSRAELAGVIRREYGRMRRAQQRELADLRGWATVGRVN